MIDEIPCAYKDIDEVMANQEDLVEVVHTSETGGLCEGMMKLSLLVALSSNRRSWQGQSRALAFVRRP